MNGEEATRNIRQKWNNQRPYIIGCTASATDQAKELCTKCGMNAFISKPLRFDILGATFDAVTTFHLPAKAEILLPPLLI